MIVSTDLVVWMTRAHAKKGGQEQIATSLNKQQLAVQVAVAELAKVN